MYEQEIKGKASTEAAMAEAVHARENGENFSQVRNVLHFQCESLKSLGGGVLLDPCIFCFF